MLSITKTCLPPPPKFSITLYHKALHRVIKCVHKPYLYFSKQLGISFVELLIMTLFLTGIAFSTAFLVTQSKTSMKSTSQIGHCPMLAKEVLEQFTTFGTRLYAYSYDGGLGHTKVNPKFRPLLIMSDTASSPAGIKDVAGHSRSTPHPSQLKFPDVFSENLKNLSMSISSGSSGDWVNTGVDIIQMKNNNIELGSSVFIVNAVNVLQYLYNADSTYFTGTRKNGSEVWGKIWSNLGSGSALEKYKKRFDLEDLNIYLLIRPVDTSAGTHTVLKTEADVSTKCQKASASGGTLTSTSYTCPKNGSHHLLLTRPRLVADIVQKIPSYVVLHGNPDLGFELKVTIEYKEAKASEKLHCDTMQTFTHQMDSIDQLQVPPVPALETMVNAAPSPVNLMATPIEIINPEDTSDKIDKATISSYVPEYVSCDTDGAGYDDIIIELNVGGLVSHSKEKGTILMCQGVTACRSGDSLQSYTGCTYQAGNWSRCHQVKFPGQTSNTKAALTGNKLKLTFENLPANKRYDLNIAEMSMAGTMSFQELVARFYIDAKRPQITGRTVKGDDVGGPLDNNKGRNYSAHHKTSPGVSWSIPTDVVGGKWLQCNQADVEFVSQIEDQFTHNLRPCKRTASRKDGNGTTNTTSNLNTLSLKTNIDDVTGTDFQKCNGKYSSIKHGRQTITLLPNDSCKKGAEKKIVWDTDLPSTFKAQNFSTSLKWFYSTSKPSYTIDSMLPATGKGTFPKHYAVDCWEHYWGPSGGSTRPDGDGSTIACNLKTSGTDIDDGCNPNKVGIDYWHVCGGSKQNKESKWAVYAPHKKSCANVRCEPDLICCDGDDGDGQTSPNPCGSVSINECEKNTYKKSCDDPKGGGNSYQDNTSDCPPLGLYSCSYSFDCDGNSPFSQTQSSSSSCTGVRENGACSFTVSGTCTPSDTNWNSSCEDDGTCSFSGQSWTKSCNSGCTSQDDTSSAYDCNCTDVMWDHDNDSTTPKVAKTQCVDDDNDPTTPCVDEVIQDCDTCYDKEYKATSSTCSQTLTGTCENPSGSCSKKTNLSRGSSTAEMCEVNSPNKTRVPAKSAKVNGDCGKNPIPGICTQGTAGSVTNNSNTCTKTWTCSGSNGGSSKSCSQTETCCPGQGKYSTKTACQAGLPSNQACICIPPCCERKNSPGCGSPETCTPTGATFTDQTDGACTADPTTQCYKWRCTYNAQTKNCEEAKAGPGCGTACLTCQPGTPNDSAVNDTSTHIKWRCSHNGMDNDTCQCEAKPQCDNSKKLGCSPPGATADDSYVADTQKYVRWRCSYNNQNIDSCECEKAICAATTTTTTTTSSTTTTVPGQCGCGNSNDTCTKSCTVKTPNDQDTDTVFEWTCEKSNLTDKKCTCTCPNNEYTTEAACKTAHSVSSCTKQSGGCGCYVPPSTCSCDNSTVDGCNSPCSADQTPADTGREFKWTCKTNNYTDSSTCTTYLSKR